MSDISKIFTRQQEFFNTGQTRSFAFRRSKLIELKSLILSHEKRIYKALIEDLGRCRLETYLSEIQLVISEIDFCLKNLKKWMRDKKQKSPLVQFPSRSFIRSEPKGSILIIAPWNYPVQLCLSPLIGAIAAGNTAVIKPSEVSEATSKMLHKMINQHFSEDYITVVEGGIPETQGLLQLPFDHIFYTGNAFVAMIVMENAAKNLTPVTLELGGKSPCLIYGHNDLYLVAKRLVWAKFFNTGQTCVAPDYVIMAEGDKPFLIEEIKKVIEEFYPGGIKNSDDYGRIINKKHFGRLEKLIENEHVICFEELDEEELFFPPTLVLGDENSESMKEEIFGPILPIIIKENIDEAIKFVRKGDRPLAGYLYSENQQMIDLFIDEISSGGMCVNDGIVQLSYHNLPFGGVGNSGMGRYHGKFSFDEFSHQKAVVVRSNKLDFPLRYPPYQGKLGVFKLLFRYLGWLLS